MLARVRRSRRNVFPASDKRGQRRSTRVSSATAPLQRCAQAHHQLENPCPSANAPFPPRHAISLLKGGAGIAGGGQHVGEGSLPRRRGPSRRRRRSGRCGCRTGWRVVPSSSAERVGVRLRLRAEVGQAKSRLRELVYPTGEHPPKRTTGVATQLTETQVVDLEVDNIGAATYHLPPRFARGRRRSDACSFVFSSHVRRGFNRARGSPRAAAPDRHTRRRRRRRSPSKSVRR